MAAIAYQNKEQVYDILFRTASETLQTIAADPKHLGAEIGFFSVLPPAAAFLQMERVGSPADRIISSYRLRC